jgi:hypothetical protein
VTSYEDGDPCSPAHHNAKLNSLVSNLSTLNASLVSTALLYNVKNYGAVGDGSTDDTAAIRSAISSAGTASVQGGGIVYFPSGIYLTTSTVTIPSGYRVSLLGDGMLSSTVSSQHSRPIFDVVSGNNGMWRLGIKGSGYTLDGARNDQNVGVYIRSTAGKINGGDVYIDSTGSFTMFFEANGGSGTLMSNLFLTPSLETESAPRYAAAIGHRGQDSTAIPRQFNNLNTSGARLFDVDGVDGFFVTNAFGHNISMTTRTARLKMQAFRLATSNTSTLVKGSDIELIGDHNGHWDIDAAAYNVTIIGSTVSGIVENRSSHSDTFLIRTDGNLYGGGKVVAHRTLSGNSATTLAPSFAFRSEESLGFFRSRASTVALSYGTFHLNQARLTSIKTTASLGTTGNGVDTEAWLTVGVSVTTLNVRSGNTTYYFASSANTNV